MGLGTLPMFATAVYEHILDPWNFKQTDWFADFMLRKSINRLAALKLANLSTWVYAQTPDGPNGPSL